MVEQSNAAKISDETPLEDTNTQVMLSEMLSEQPATADEAMSDVEFTLVRHPSSQAANTTAKLERTEKRTPATQVETSDPLLPEEEKLSSDAADSLFKGVV